MKQYILSLFLIFGVTSLSLSQEISYGLKGGINYTMGGQITGTQARFSDETFEANGEIGFHGGAFGQINFGNFFVRPEVVYTSLESTFEFPNQPATYSVETVTVPLLVGYNIFGPLDIYAGPVYSNVLSSTLEGEEFLDPIVVQDSPINAQIGAKVEYGRFGIDVRYEHNLSSEEVQGLDILNAEYGVNEATFDDSRLHQVVVSIIFKIGGPGLNERRRRPCY
ncbi:hypothetical protein GCM10007103_04290 [Salinimicrobium marinum]|uniref:Outer membrane protein beta-barrel domain-containing protein n=1 Tax=Salinimicrobium marinum TaxID=680283 RepID=A0A918S5W3_9FLAO|nr:outer membrane beta-barrel protein [Salinimicrobium marinum]GHA26119.1 hypothetical protein GCM10007103_04290 [Salinimicrobium marinum]